jgi:ribose transport system permease protein
MEKILDKSSYIIFVGILLYFGISAPKFFHPQNLLMIFTHASSIAIIATGMTFVLLTAGIDLSVGAVMFLAGVFAGKLVLAGHSMYLALAVILLTGIVFGLINGLFIIKFKLAPFIVTLATLFIGRGLGLWISKTRAMNLPESFLKLGSSTIFFIPTPVVILFVVLIISHIFLTQTSWGRYIYAVGDNRDAAEKAGIDVNKLLLSVYIISGFCAALGGIVSVAQLGAVSPTFGNNREFQAIAAAVLGGTSLWGGKGTVLPGTIMGAILIQTIESGLVAINADPYIYPLVTSTVIFFAVFLDSVRRLNYQTSSRGR